MLIITGCTQYKKLPEKTNRPTNLTKLYKPTRKRRIKKIDKHDPCYFRFKTLSNKLPPMPQKNITKSTNPKKNKKEKKPKTTRLPLIVTGYRTHKKTSKKRPNVIDLITFDINGQPNIS